MVCCFSSYKIRPVGERKFRSFLYGFSRLHDTLWRNGNILCGSVVQVSTPTPSDRGLTARRYMSQKLSRTPLTQNQWLFTGFCFFLIFGCVSLGAVKAIEQVQSIKSPVVRETGATSAIAAPAEMVLPTIKWIPPSEVESQSMVQNMP